MIDENKIKNLNQLDRIEYRQKKIELDKNFNISFSSIVMYISIVVLFISLLFSILCFHIMPFDSAKQLTINLFSSLSKGLIAGFVTGIIFDLIFQVLYIKRKKNIDNEYFIEVVKNGDSKSKKTR